MDSVHAVIILSGWQQGSDLHFGRTSFRGACHLEFGQQKCSPVSGSVDSLSHQRADFQSP